ncbi:hypothetical protein ACFQAT_15190 [Undibacterium arcticum]
MPSATTRFMTPALIGMRSSWYKFGANMSRIKIDVYVTNPKEVVLLFSH